MCWHSLYSVIYLYIPACLAVTFSCNVLLICYVHFASWNDECIDFHLFTSTVKIPMLSSKYISTQNTSNNIKQETTHSPKKLTNAKLPKTSPTSPIKKCSCSNCVTCIHLIEGTVYKFQSEYTFRHKNITSFARQKMYFLLLYKVYHKDYIRPSEIGWHPTTRQIPLGAHLDFCAQNKSSEFLVFSLYQCSDGTTVQMDKHGKCIYSKIQTTTLHNLTHSHNAYLPQTHAETPRDLQTLPPSKTYTVAQTHPPTHAHLNTITPQTYLHIYKYTHIDTQSTQH